jgi:hypothetical protein
MAVLILVLNKKGIKVIPLIYHKILGGTAFVLSLLHVLFAVAGYWNF